MYRKEQKHFILFLSLLGHKRKLGTVGVFEGIYLPPVSPSTRLEHAEIFSRSVCSPTQKSYVKICQNKTKKYLECKSKKRILLDMKYSVEYLIRLASFTPLRLRFTSSLLAFWVIPLSFSPVLYLPLSLTFTQLISRHGSSRGKYHCP